MTINKEHIAFESSLSSFVSLLFRCVIIIYSLFILSLYTDNYFGKNYYIIYSLYTIVFLVSFNRTGGYSRLRLFNDYLFISLILYGKEMNQLFLFIFLLLPILNTRNHSGKKQSMINYVFFIIACSLLVNNFWVIPSIIAILSLLVIEFFTQIKLFLKDLTQSLNIVIDTFIDKTSSFRNTHRILKDIKKEVNKNNKVPFIIEDIICLNYVESKEFFHIINATSAFIWEYSLTLDDKNDFKKLKSGKVLIKKLLRLNATDKQNTILVPVNYENHMHIYIFLIAGTKGSDTNNFALYIASLLIPDFGRLLKRISTIQKLGYEMLKMIEKNMERTKKRYIYVNNAITALHFLRNKFGPLVNHFEMTTFLQNNDGSLDEEQKAQIESIIADNYTPASKALKDIKNKANQILNKENNPFIFMDYSPFNIKKIFETTRSVWEDVFGNNLIEFNWSITDEAIVNKKKYKINEEGFHILLVDITANARKYGTNFFKLIFNEDDEYYRISFVNEINKTSMGELEKHLLDFNTNRPGVNMTKSHGLYLIKSFLTQMEIEHKFYISGENKVNFELSFKKD